MNKLTIKTVWRNLSGLLRNNAFFSPVTVCFLLFWTICSNSYSQNQISREASLYPEAVVSALCTPDPTVPDCIITELPAQLGIAYTFRVQLTVNNLVTYSANYDFTPCSNTPAPTISYTSGNTYLDVTIPGTCICNSDPLQTDNYIDIRVHVENPDGAAEQVFRIPLPRKPLKIALVLDISGSMSLPTPGDNIDHTPRWDVLKQAVNTFMEKLETEKHPLDSIALTYFTTYIIQPNFATTNNFIEITPSNLLPATNLSSYIINADMNPPRHPLDLTAMGLGLMDGKSKLRGNVTTPEGAKKIVLLFTDGLQNVYPLVKVDGETLDDGRKLNDCSPTCPADQLIRYYMMSIGVGPGTGFEILQDIASNNGGTYQGFTVGDANDLNVFFQNTLEDILYASSPQTVAGRIGILSSGNADQKFVVNKNIKTVLFELLSKESDSITINVVKDGMTLTPDINRHDSHHKLIGFSLPAGNAATKVYSNGVWDVTLKGSSQKQYMLSCYVDDHFLKYDINVNKTIFTVGDSIKFKVSLNYAQKPVKNPTVNVEALVFKPGDDLGNLLSTYNTPDTTKLQDVQDPADKKFQALLTYDSAFYHALLPSEQIVDLKSDTNGIFTGSFSKTELSGIYKIIYVMKGDLPLNGSFERTKTSNAIFVFGNVAPETPVVVPNPTFMPDSAKHKNFTVVKIRPKNKFGYLMGPGYKSKISVIVNPTSKKVSSASFLPVGATTQPYVEMIKDNLDGSYLIYIANVPKSSNPVIQINVRGEKLYHGKLHPIPCWVDILLIILIILLFLIMYFRSAGAGIYKILLWIVSLIVLILILLQYFGIIVIF